MVGSGSRAGDVKLGGGWTEGCEVRLLPVAMLKSRGWR